MDLVIPVAVVAWLTIADAGVYVTAGPVITFTVMLTVCTKTIVWARQGTHLTLSRKQEERLSKYWTNYVNPTQRYFWPIFLSNLANIWFYLLPWVWKESLKKLLYLEIGQIITVRTEGGTEENGKAKLKHFSSLRFDATTNHLPSVPSVSTQKVQKNFQIKYFHVPYHPSGGAFTRSIGLATHGSILTHARLLTLLPMCPLRTSLLTPNNRKF